MLWAFLLGWGVRLRRIAEGSLRKKCSSGNISSLYRPLPQTEPDGHDPSRQAVPPSPSQSGLPGHWLFSPFGQYV